MTCIRRYLLRWAVLQDRSLPAFPWRANRRITHAARPWSWLTTGLLLGAFLAVPVSPAWAAVGVQDARSLRDSWVAVRGKLSGSPFGRPLLVTSQEESSHVRGDVYAVIDQPLDAILPALRSPTRWCDILLLHLNVKDCQLRGTEAHAVLSMAVGRRHDQALESAQRIDFVFHVASSAADHLAAAMSAESGPFGTRNYHISVGAVAIDAKSSYLHFAYSHGFGAVARLSLQTYLATAGSSKVGFTVVGRDAEDKPVYIDGLRGVIERNAMRYYLAIEVALRGAPPSTPDQTLAQVRAWFDGTERYARQLHELARDEYVAMKLKDIARARAAASR